MKTACRNERILMHLPLARSIAGKVARRLPGWVALDDLMSAAMIGLAEAADRYDPSREEPFLAFAEKRIRGAVLDELRRGDLLSRRSRRRANEAKARARQLMQTLGRAPSEDELASSLGVSVDEYRDDVAPVMNLRQVDLDERSQLLSCPAANAGQQLEARELSRDLQAALAELPPRDAQLLAMYYEDDLGFAAIGRKFGVSESRVCQLHGRAIARLREKLMPQFSEQIAA